jgi:hypothetical protein
LRPKSPTPGGAGAGSAEELAALAAERLGRCGRAVRRELRALPASLQQGERVLALARGWCGMRGGLVVASDRRLLLLARSLPLRRPGTRGLAYAQLASMAGRVDGDRVWLGLDGGGSVLSLELAPADAGQELAQPVAWRAGFRRVDTLPAPIYRPGDFVG